MGEAATATEPAVSAFQQARDAAAAKAMPGSFMSAEDRAAFHAEKTPFWIVRCGTTTGGQYGDRVQFVLLTDPSHAANGEFDADVAKVLDLGYSAFRDELAGELNKIIAREKIVGPLYLSKFRTGSGNDAWDLTDEIPGDDIPY